MFNDQFLKPAVMKHALQELSVVIEMIEIAFHLFKNIAKPLPNVVKDNGFAFRIVNAQLITVHVQAKNNIRSQLKPGNVK